MKYFFVLAFLWFHADCCAQARMTNPPLVQAGTVLSPAAADYRSSPSAQASNWKLETIGQPSNGPAWLNYYIWTERDQQIATPARKRLLTQIAADARKAILKTAEYSMLLYLESGKKDRAALFKSLASATDKKWVYPYVIQFLIRQQQPGIEDYCQLLDSLSPLTQSLYEYHHNALMSADSNATIYAQGLNDLVPMAVLQQVHGVRKDIRLRHYEAGQAMPANAYLCLSLGKEILSQYPGAVYTGLLVKPAGSTGIDELKKHVANDFDLSFLESGVPAGNEAVLYKNYLPSFILLYRHYKNEGNPAAAGMRTIIERIANNAGIESEVNTQLEK